MPSFDPQLPISNPFSTDDSTIHSFHTSDFGTFEQSIGFRVQSAVNLSGRRFPICCYHPTCLFSNTTKPSSQAVPSDPLPIVAFEKSSASLNINPSTPTTESQRFPQGPEPKDQQSNLASISCGNLENWEESAMAEGSPRTDIPTDVDTDERNQMFDRGQSLTNVASDSSDRSKDKSDQKEN